MSPADGDDRDVLTSLPHARPTRRSAKRAGTAAGAPATPAGADAEAAPKAAAAPKPKAARRAPAAAKPKARPAAKASAPKGSGARRAKPAPPPPSAVPPAGWATQPESREAAGTGELVGTALQAVGELAQIGLSYGGRSLRQALSRLPRP